jgi:hypothetical protein
MKSCAVPCFPGKPRMYQQSSFPVNTFTLLSHGPWMSSFVCSDAAIQRPHQQSNCNDGPTHHGLSYCLFFAVEFKRNEATGKDIPRSSSVVRSFASVSGDYHSSIYRVRCSSLVSHLIYLFRFSGSDEAVSISTLRASESRSILSP